MGCLEGVGRMSRESMLAVWRLCIGCLGECRACLESMGKLFGVDGVAVWGVWGGDVEGVGRLSGG